MLISPHSFGIKIVKFVFKIPTTAVCLVVSPFFIHVSNKCDENRLSTKINYSESA